MAGKALRWSCSYEVATKRRETCSHHVQEEGLKQSWECMFLSSDFSGCSLAWNSPGPESTA